MVFLILGLKLAYRVFRFTDNLSSVLQSSDLSCSDGSLVAESVVDKLKRLRTDKEFEEFYAEVKIESDKLGKHSEHSLTCYFMVTFVTNSNILVMYLAKH